VNQYTSIDPTTTADSGCTVFPATTLAAEYLIVPQLTASDTGVQVGFRLVGDTILPAPTPSPSLQSFA